MKRVRVVIASALVGLFTIVACAQLAPPPDDPSKWPCGEPRMQWCPGHKTCCYSDEICRPDGWCAANAEIPTIRAKQKVADAGADQ
jgi:hypothetical protein